MLQEFDIQVVCVNIEIQSACRFDGINESVYMSLGNIFFLDVCIEINTFLLIIPDDGYYPVYFGYDAKGKVCAVYVRFIDIEDSYKEQE